MTIKQLGGVFGRNPTFNDVTIEGQLTFDGDIDINSDLTIDGVLNVEGETNIKANSGSLSHKFSYNENGGEISLYDNASAQATLIDQANNTTRMLELVDGSNMEIGLGGGNTTGYVQFKSAGYANAMRITSNKNVEIQDGDLVIGTSGHGIDFSATSGTGTSELFDDYEEGAVTNPLYVGGTQITSGYSVNGATYTKVGDTVIMNIYIDYTSPSGTGPTGNVTIGLPFTPTNSAILGTSIYMSVSAAAYAGAFFSVASGVGTVAVTPANINSPYSLAQGERIIVRAAIAYRAS
jgi:hypothetical protein